MQIAPPFGYREIVPFLKTQKVHLLAPGEVPEFARRGNRKGQLARAVTAGIRAPRSGR